MKLYEASTNYNRDDLQTIIKIVCTKIFKIAKIILITLIVLALLSYVLNGYWMKGVLFNFIGSILGLIILKFIPNLAIELMSTFKEERAFRNISYNFYETNFTATFFNKVHKYNYGAIKNVGTSNNKIYIRTSFFRVFIIKEDDFTLGSCHDFYNFIKSLA